MGARERSRPKGKSRAKATNAESAQSSPRRRGVRGGQGGATGPDVPWRIRFEENVLETDASSVGTVGMDAAKNAIEKKLKIAPLQYGDPLRRELKLFRKLKTSDIRIVYYVNEDTHEVWVLAVGNRRDIWDESAEMFLKRFAALNEYRRGTIMEDSSLRRAD